MKKVLLFFKNRITIEVIILTLVSLLLWFGLAYIKFGEENTTLSSLAKLLMIFVIWVIWILKHTFQLWKKSQATGGATAPAPQAMAEPSKNKTSIFQRQQSNSEIEALKKSFETGLGKLKSSNLSASLPGLTWLSSGNKKIYGLPWYTVIGAPGSGKTTFITNSGMEFPLNSADDAPQNKHSLNTKHCDWWFSNHGVFLDTAGRYTTQDNNRKFDSSAWLSFLGLLKKYRKRRPLNGVIVTISAQDLLLHEAQRSTLAKSLRERLDEINTELSAQIPVYIAITKMDLIAGFSAFFAHLSEEEKHELWGITLSTAQTLNDNQFVQEFGELILRINSRVSALMAKEQDPNKRMAIQNFPTQLGEVISSLRALYNEAFSPNEYQQAPLVRGIYLTSAAQEGSPVDKVMSATSSHFRLSRSRPIAQPSTKQSFFIRNIFAQVIFNESNIGGLNDGLEKRMNMTRWIASAVLLVLSILIGLSWNSSYQYNKQLMDNEQSQAALFEQRFILHRFNKSDPANISQILRSVLSAKAQHLEEPSLLGINDGRVAEAVDRLYLTALNKTLLPELKLSIEEQLNQKLMLQEDGDIFDILKVYLMLGSPSVRENDVITEYFAKAWEQKLPNSPEIQSDLNVHLKHLLAHSQKSAELNNYLITSARARLSILPAPERLYSAFLSRLSKQDDISLADILGKDGLALFSLKPTDRLAKIPYAYTRHAYAEADFSSSSQLLSDYKSTRWIVGEEGNDAMANDDINAIAVKMKKLYLSDYLKFWEKRLNQYELGQFKNLSQASEGLELLADPARSPIVNLLSVVVEHTQLTKPANLKGVGGGKVGKATKALAGLGNKLVKPTQVDLRFKSLHEWYGEEGKPSDMQSVLMKLQSLQGFVSDIQFAPNNAEIAFQTAKNKFSKPSSDAFVELKRAMRGSPNAVQKWLSRISDQSWKTVISKAYQFANRNLANEVCNYFDNELSGKFPLSNSASDASTTDFNEYFSPAGIEAAFASEYIAPFVNLSNGQYRRVDGRSFPIRAETLTLVRRAEAIRTALYSQNPEIASLKLKMLPLKLDGSVRSFSLQSAYDQPPISYKHGPKLPSTVDWNSSASGYAQLSFTDISGSSRSQEYISDWSMLRLLNDSIIEGTRRDNVLNVTFHKDDLHAKYQVKSNSSLEAIQYGSLLKYQCPSSL